MSAFICSDKHIGALVRWASEHKVTAYHGVPGRTYEVKGNEQDIGDILFQENVKSVNYRYQEDGSAESFFYPEDSLHLSAIEIYKLAQSLKYQSCEHPEWSTSLAKEIIRSIQREAINRMPGYEFAKWSI